MGGGSGVLVETTRATSSVLQGKGLGCLMAPPGIQYSLNPTHLSFLGLRAIEVLGQPGWRNPPPP